MPVHPHTATALSAPALLCLGPGSRSQAPISPKYRDSLPTLFRPFGLIFFCSPSRYKDIVMKNVAAASAVDAQIPGELCQTAIAVSKHPTKYTLQVKKSLLFHSISKGKEFLFLVHSPLFSLQHKQVLQGKKHNKEKQNKFRPYCKDYKNPCTWNNKQIKW